MKQIRLAALAAMAVSLLVLTSCGEKTSTITVDGSSTVYPITEAIAEEFLKEQPNIRITVGFSGTGGGIKKFIAGDIDICDASRGIKESEVESCQKAEVEYIELEVAFDGLAVIVHPDNDWCDGLTVAQLKELWRPESAVMKWSDLNPDWPTEEIKLYGPGTDSGTFDYFTKAIVGEEGASRADYTASEDDNVLVTGVQEDRFALGYLGYAYYSENKDKLKLLGIDEGTGPVSPSEGTVRDGSYSPLSRPLYIYVRRSSLDQPAVAQFIRFYLDNVNDLAREVGYVPISAEAAKKNEQAMQSRNS